MTFYVENILGKGTLNDIPILTQIFLIFLGFELVADHN